MGRYIIRRTLIAIPTLLAISLIIFLILDSAPGDPTSNLPLTIPAEVRAQIRESLGLNDPWYIQWFQWNKLMLINEPLHVFNSVFGSCIGNCEDPERIISWSSRSPAMDTIYERLPQTFWVLGLSLVLGVMVAIPVGTLQAVKQYSWFDNFGTFFTMLGYSVPTFVTGLMTIVFFSVKLRWLPTFYRTTHDVNLTDWSTIWFQFKQLVMPVGVLTLFNMAIFGRFTRASVLENLNQGYVRTARSKGLGEFPVIVRHVLRNSLIPVVTLFALSIPGIFGGAIITEQIFRINGLGQLLIISIAQSDLPMVQSLTFIFAFLTVFFNLVADVLYGFLDPRIRYD